jgi:hypothetical protein
MSVKLTFHYNQLIFNNPVKPAQIFHIISFLHVSGLDYIVIVALNMLEIYLTTNHF